MTMTTCDDDNDDDDNQRLRVRGTSGKHGMAWHDMAGQSRAGQGSAVLSVRSVRHPAATGPLAFDFRTARTREMKAARRGVDLEQQARGA